MAWRNPCTPIPDSGIPNSEFRMAYGESGIPHHEIAGLGGAHEGHMRSAGAGDGGGGHGMSNANNGVGHSMSWGGGELRPGEPYSHGKWPTLK